MENIDELERMFINGRYDELSVRIRGALRAINFPRGNDEVIFLAKVAGWLIDISTSRKSLADARQGVEIYETHLDKICQLFHAQSIEYNIGNGYHNIYLLTRTEDSIPLDPELNESILKAKDYFWRAYKKKNAGGDGLLPQILHNISSTLVDSSRVVEALDISADSILKFSDFSFSYSGYANALLAYRNHARHTSIALLGIAANNYQYAINKKGGYPESYDSWRRWHQAVTEKLTSLGAQSSDFIHGHEDTAFEYNQHSKYWRFVLEERLSLSEHGQYCACACASRDDLVIPTSSMTIVGDSIPRMSYMLNRLKSEYNCIRYMYYMAIEGDYEDFEDVNNMLRLTDLYEDEWSGVKSEFARTSFKIVFSILDKVAYSVCNLFDVLGTKELVYFDSFLFPDNSKQSTLRRWEILRNVRNRGLAALFSQSTDLTSKYQGGEYRYYKKLRNKMEHEFCLVQMKDAVSLDPYRIQEGMISVSHDDFLYALKHMLRFVKASIFYFVWCVREHCEYEPQDDHVHPYRSGPNFIPMTLKDKLL